MNLNRRGFLGGLISAIAAPAIVKPEILMPIKTLIIPKPGLLTLDEITREAIKLFKNSNVYIDKQYNLIDTVGSTLIIRLPKDYLING